MMAPVFYMHRQARAAAGAITIRWLHHSRHHPWQHELPGEHLQGVPSLPFI